MLMATIGCAAASTLVPSTTPSISTARATTSPVVAHLTAADAVYNALSLATPEPSVVSLPPVVIDERPTRWTPGSASSLAGELKSGQSLAIALRAAKVPQSSSHPAVLALAEHVDLRRSQPGDAWEVDVDATGAVQRLRYAASPTSVWQTTLQNGTHHAERVALATEKRTEVANGRIQGSLWGAFEAADVDPRIAAAFIDVFAYTIDFVTETQPNDRFWVVYESQWLDGERVGVGRILAARYAGAEEDARAFRWNDAYYDEDGESVERQFLRSPLATVRITSRYGRRFHPVLGKMKMHAGVDYGAPTGTPVRATANGTVTHAGWKGANGNLITIRHAGGYTTSYAHLSKIAKGLRPGVRVDKKQVIGRVGSTGRSTGPHLHFGMKHNGRTINPLEIDFERGEPLNHANKTKFKSVAGALDERMR